MVQCPECGTTGMTKYSKPEMEDSEALWTCTECAWIGKEKEIKAHETEHAQRFLRMCEESLSPEPFEMLEDHIIPALEKARRIVITEKCPKCGQTDVGQEIRGEYPCPDCGLPTARNEKEE